MRLKGKLRTWNGDKGYGFIVPESGGKDVFLHVSAFGNRDRRPEVGQVVTYALSKDNQGRPRAVKATLPGHRLSLPKTTTGAGGTIFVSGAFMLLVAWSVLSGRLPALVLWGYLAASVVTFLVYAYDKVAAKDGAWRTQESTLHLLSVVGGWPGALVAQQKLRHKSKKETFRSAFWMTVVLNLGVFAWMFTPMGVRTVNSWIGGAQSLLGVGKQATIEWAEPRDQ